MNRFTLEQRWEMLKTYFQSDCCVAETVRNLKIKFGPNNAPTAPAVRKFVKKVREKGILIDNTSYPRVRPALSSENIAAVAESIRLNPTMSTRHRAQELNISRTTLRRIMQIVSGHAANSDDVKDEDSDDVPDDARPIGRPQTGAVNLNILRTGRGQGRPKMKVPAANGSGIPKKRGRPTTSASPKVATGSPRGRPKAVNNASEDQDGDSQEDDDDDVVSVEETEETPSKHIDDDDEEEEEEEDEDVGVSKSNGDEAEKELIAA